MPPVGTGGARARLSLDKISVLLILRQTLKTGAILKPLLSKRMLFAYAIGAAIVVMPLILFAPAHLDTFGIWIALAIGVVVTISVSAASLFERHQYLKRIDVEKCASKFPD